MNRQDRGQRTEDRDDDRRKLKNVERKENTEDKQSRGHGQAVFTEEDGETFCTKLRLGKNNV